MHGAFGCVCNRQSSLIGFVQVGTDPTEVRGDAKRGCPALSRAVPSALASSRRIEIRWGPGLPCSDSFRVGTMPEVTDEKAPAPARAVVRASLVRDDCLRARGRG